MFLTNRTLFTNIFVFVTTQSCARGLCDTHLPDLNHSASQSKRSSCSRVSRDRRNRRVSGASFPSLITTHILHLLLPLCLLCFPACLVFLLLVTALLCSYNPSRSYISTMGHGPNFPVGTGNPGWNRSNRRAALAEHAAGGRTRSPTGLLRSARDLHINIPTF